MYVKKSTQSLHNLLNNFHTPEGAYKALCDLVLPYTSGTPPNLSLCSSLIKLLAL